MMIRIFAMKAAGQDFTAARWNRYLSEERRAEAEKRKNEKERQLFLAAEVLLNLSLEHAGADNILPAAYRRNSYGKPYLLQNQEIKVNWSHSGAYAVCALADCEVGIDLQDMGKMPKEALVRRFLQPEERIFYENAPEEQKKLLFYQFWTVKESFLKAAGTGFHTPLDSFYVRMSGAEPKIVQRESGRNYGCRLLDFEDKNYAAAVCCESDSDLGPIDIKYFL